MANVYCLYVEVVMSLIAPATCRFSSPKAVRGTSRLGPLWFTSNIPAIAAENVGKVLNYRQNVAFE